MRLSGHVRHIGLALLLAALALLWTTSRRPEPAVQGCADIVAGCAVDGAELRVQFDRPPRPLKPFVVTVAWPGVQSVHARFLMPGMEMGLNRYRMLPAGPGRWRAEVMLPACVQARSDWQIELESERGRYALPFSAGDAGQEAGAAGK